MGFFDFVKGFFKKAAKSAGSFFQGTGKKIEAGAKQIYNDYKSVPVFIGKQIDKVTTTASTLTINGQSKAFELGNKLVDKGSELGGKTIDTVGNIAWPLAIGAAILGGVLLFKK